MIEAGRISDLKWTDDNWIFVDIGFSGKKKSCGVIFGGEQAECLTFGNAQRKIAQFVSAKTSVNLVIEAPLSVCFSRNGDPEGRDLEKLKGATRYWYCGLGCVVMTAAIYLVRAVALSNPTARIRLFEGFVSYKKKGAYSDHRADVERLREAVRNSDVASFRAPKALNGGELRSALAIAGIECDCPAIIYVGPGPS